MGPLERLDTTTAVETPERVRFHHRVAGPGLRGVAWAVDVTLQAAVVLAVGIVLALASVGGDVVSGLSVGLGLVVFFLMSWFYAAFFEWIWAGQTPGKRIAHVRVVREDGGRIGVREAVLRNLARGVDGLPFGYVVGVIACTIDPRMRRVGDWVAGTMVVVELRTDLLDQVPITPPVSEDERQALPVRVTLSGDERRAIEDLLRRQRTLSPARVEELARHLGPGLAERTGVVAPTSLRTLTLAYARATGREVA